LLRFAICQRTAPPPRSFHAPAFQDRRDCLSLHPTEGFAIACRYNAGAAACPILRGADMKGDPKVVDYLNRVLTNELTAINQYFLHARMFRHWGLKKLDEYEYQESVDEMKHADKLINRILFLEGLPNLQQLNKLLIGEDVPEALKCDLRLEMDAIPLLREAINYCESVKDFVTRELFEDILDGEEEHVDWLETQLDLLSKVGLQNYLQSQM
jgi:bacterioferritin